MDVREALAELGLEQIEGTEQVRRTYLRQLKKRKPEVDPEGFRRLREAYELLLVAIATGQPTPSNPPPTPQEPAAEPAPAKPAPPEAATAAHEGAALAPELEELFARAAAVPGPQRAKRIEILREAVAAFPTAAAAHQRLISELVKQGLGEDAIDAARAAVKAGFPAAVGVLCDEYPYRVTREDLLTAGPLLAWTMLVKLLRTTVDLDLAVVRCAVERALEADRRAWPSPPNVARVALALMDRGFVAQALSAIRQTSAALQELGAAAWLEERGVWILAEELACLPDEFPELVRVALARALLSNNLYRANAELSRFRAGDRLAACRARALMSEHAPTLDQMLGVYVNGEAVLRTPQNGWRAQSALDVATVEANAEGEADRECPSCRSKTRMPVRAIHVRRRFRPPVRAGDLLVCPRCHATSRTWTRPEGLRMAAAAFAKALAMAILGVASFAGMTLLIWTDWQPTGGDSAKASRLLELPVLLGGTLLLFCLVVAAGFARRAWRFLRLSAPTPFRLEAPRWQPY